MKIQSMLIALALGASTCLLQAQPDQRQDQGPGTAAQSGPRPGRRQGGPGGPGGGFHIIPPFAQDQLNLTDDQKKQIEDLEKRTKAKLDSILTEEQKKKLQDMRSQFRGRGPGGPGGQGGPGANRPPGGGQQRPPADQ